MIGPSAPNGPPVPIAIAAEIGFRMATRGWIRLPLTPADMRTKRAALAKYTTQQHAMKWFLDGFVRTNELFSRPAATRVVLPLKHDPCS